jgi:hypothetical protein
MTTRRRLFNICILALGAFFAGCATQQTVPDDPPDSARWPGMSELPWTDWMVASAYPKVSYRIRVHPSYSRSNKDYGTSGHLAQIEVRNDESEPANVTVSAFMYLFGDGWNDSLGTYYWTLTSTGERPEAAKKGILLPPGATVSGSAGMRRTNDFLKFTAKVLAPDGWNPPWHRNINNIFWKSETSSEETYVGVPDDPSKSGRGYEVTVTFWNRRADPVVIDFAITDGSLEGMPDVRRHAGSGSVTLLGGQQRSVSRSSPVRSWTIQAKCKASVLE